MYCNVAVRCRRRRPLQSIMMNCLYIILDNKHIIVLTCFSYLSLSLLESAHGVIALHIL